MPKQTIRARVYDLLEPSKKTGNLSWFIDLFIITLIALNVAAIVMASVEPFRVRNQNLLDTFEMISVIIFSVEYVLRIWASPENPKYRKPVVGYLRYAVTPLAIIDLLAIAPFYIALLSVDLRFVRILWLLRIFRLFKAARYIKSLALMGRVIQSRKGELTVAVVFILLLLLISSTLMYYVEFEAQPDVFGSIPETMWWGISTLTTVGYGDVFPITGLGKLLGGVIAILGIGLFAIPAGILAAGISDELSRARNRDNNPS